jgi:raffinose/stachyose/melibiose transport system substrate-binding protein
MKRAFVYILGGICLIAVLFLFPSGQKEKTEQKSEKVRLEFYNRKREVYAVLEEIIEKFNASQDEIEVYQNMNTNADASLRISAVEGDFPDVVELGGLQSVETFEYVMGGCLRPLDNMECVERIKDEYLPYLRYNSHIYQMPLAMSFEGIYINKDLFLEEGLTIPKTYEELCQVSREIQKRGKVPFLFADKESWTVHQNWESIEGAYRGNFESFWTEVATGKTSFTEDPISRGSLEKLIELHQYTTEECSNLNYDEAMTKFASGESFMFMQGSWAYGSIMERNPQMNVELIPFPVDNGSEQLVTMWIDSSVGISKDCKYPEEAERFVEFLMQPENLQIYLDAECSLSSMEGNRDRAEYAPKVHELLREDRAVMDASWLPLQTSVIRDKDILELMPDASAKEIDAYLDKYTKSLQKYKDVYLEAKERKQ